MKKVFVSSTIWDLTDVRAELREFLARNGFDPVMSDDDRFPDDLKQAGTYEKCRQALLQCDIFLMIINSRYGGARNPKPGEISITHQEFRWAVEAKKDFVCFLRNKVEEDLSTWKNNGRDPSVRLSFIKPKDLQVLELVEEIQKGASDGSALWRSTFIDSVDLKKKLGAKLGVDDYTSNYLAQAQRLNALPRLVIRFHGGSGGAHELTHNYLISNIGSGSAEQIRVLVTKNSRVERDENLRDISAGGEIEWKASLSRESFSHSGNVNVQLHYRNILGNAFQSDFSFFAPGGNDLFPKKIEKIYFGPPKGLS